MEVASLIQTSAPYLHPAAGRSAPADRLIGHISYLNCVNLAISCRAALLRVPSVVAATVKSNKLLMLPLQMSQLTRSTRFSGGLPSH